MNCLSVNNLVLIKKKNVKLLGGCSQKEPEEEFFFSFFMFQRPQKPNKTIF